MSSYNKNNYIENKTGLKILTHNGYEKFKGINKIEKNEYIHLHFNDFSELKCSLDHPIILQSGKIKKAKDITHIDLIKGKHGSLFLLYSEIKHEKIVLYDIISSGKDNVYYTNNVLSHNCEFHGSSGTLISGDILKVLTYKKPLKTLKIQNAELLVYEEPKPLRVYATGVDVGSGDEKDYTVVSVIDVTEFPYKQVAICRNNSIIPTLFSVIVYKINMMYNKAYCLVETNNDKTIANDLYNLYQYENLISSQVLEGENIISNTAKANMGIQQTKKTKRDGCKNLKNLIENELLIINDEETIKELNVFSKKGNSYEAERGKHDDIVMSLVLITWFTSQQYFNDIMGSQGLNDYLRQRFVEENEEDFKVVFGLYNDNTDLLVPNNYYNTTIYDDYY